MKLILIYMELYVEILVHRCLHMCGGHGFNGDGAQREGQVLPFALSAQNKT